MRRKKTQEPDEDGIITPKADGGNEPLEAFINHDLIEDFIDVYSAGSPYNFTHVFTRQMLRQMFGAYLDFNTVDPLPAYISELAKFGFRERIGLNHEPVVYVVEKELPYVEEIEEDEDYGADQ